MKKTFMFLLLLISLLKTATGQDEKPITAGHFMVGGSISYYSQTSMQSLYISPGQSVRFTTKEDVFQPDVIIGYYFFNHLAFSLHADANTHAIK